MRKVFLSFIAVLLWTGIFAESVDVSSARRVAESFLAGIEAKNIGQLNDITSTTPFREFYVFSIGDEGFILVSADDCVLPILGYSLTNKFSVKNMPKNVKAVLEGYDEQIRFYKEQANTATLRTSDGGVSENDIVAEQWKMLLSGTAPEPDYTTSVAPLLTTTWNQSPYYNNMCPYDENYYENTVTGCVATATAQIMKYWNHPTTGYGSHSYNHSAYGTLSANFGTTTYDWNNMPTALSTNSTTAELNAVATLMYHVGVAIEMDYGVSATGGSGANNYSVLGEVNASSQHALVEYFKYSPDMQVLSKAEYSDADWDAVLMAELDQNRPILYSGRDLSGGHSYVCDGYNQEGMFHINWGWGGYCDGYYEMGALNPAPGGTGGNATYTFNLKNVVVLGIRPNTDWNTSTVVTATANSASYGNVTGAGTYTFGDIVEIKAMPVDGYRFKQWNDGSKYNPRKFVATGGNYSYTAIFEPLQGDTLGYSANTCLSAYNVDDWGIKLPGILFPNGDTLMAVQFYVYEEGTYDLTVYTGGSSIEQAVYTSTYVATESGSWQTIPLTTPAIVAPNQSVWLTLHCTDVAYPGAVSYYTGGYNSFLVGESFTAYDNTNSFMIRGIFGEYTEEDNDTDSEDCIVINNDTVSYCGDNLYETSVGVGVADTAFQWGILLPGNSIENRNTVESVLLYVPVTGNYIMKIYQGDPATLIHRQQYTATATGWANIMLPAELPLDNSQNLLITFSSPDVDYPAAACNSVGCSNSDWFSVGDGWGHIGDQNLNYSWLIKCVMKESDTISYCGNRPYIGCLTYEVSDSNFVWGINLPSNTLTNRDVLESVQLFVPTLGTYVLKVYSTNTSSIHDSTLVYRQEYTATELSWNTIVLDDMLVIDKTKDLYVMFSIISNTPVTPLAVCDYAGNVYSSLYYEDEQWYYTNNFSWLIKCITRKVCPITIECLGNGQGIVSLSASPLNNVCGQTYYLRNGDTATYIFTPSVGSTLAGVMLNSTDYMSNLQPLGQGAYSLSFVVTDTTILQSIFAINEYQLSVSLADAAMGAVTGAGTYHHGDTVAITAVPNQETFFVNWNDGDTNNPRIIVIDRDTAFTATFGYYTIYNTILDTICSNEIYTDNGFNTAVEGTYTDTIHTAIGSDSIVTLVLTVIPTSTGVDVQEACNSYTWIDGITYTESTNTPTYTITAANGCDSVVTLHLTINPSAEAVDSVVSCDSYTWIDGITYTESTNTPTYIITAANGCDSVVTLHLTINLSVYDTIVDYAETEYTWNDTTYTESGTYQYVDVTTDGCDSIVTLILTIGDVGIDGADVLESLTFYPNPTTGNITFNRSDILKVEVLDAVGRVVAVYEHLHIIDLSKLSNGYYTMRVTTPEGVAIRKVIRK